MNRTLIALVGLIIAAVLAACSNDRPPNHDDMSRTDLAEVQDLFDCNDLGWEEATEEDRSQMQAAMGYSGATLIASCVEEGPPDALPPVFIIYFFPDVNDAVLALQVAQDGCDSEHYCGPNAINAHEYGAFLVTIGRSYSIYPAAPYAAALSELGFTVAENRGITDGVETHAPPTPSAATPSVENEQFGDDDGVPAWTLDDLVEATCAPGAFNLDLGADMFGMASPVGYCETAKDGSGRLLYGGYSNMADMGYDCQTILYVSASARCVYASAPSESDIDAMLFLVAAYEPDPGVVSNVWEDVEPILELGFSAGE